jgi:hypothetical protein
MIIGYSLAHNQLFAPVFAESLGLLNRVQEQGDIGSASEAIIGQKCMKAEYQKGGLMGKMDRILYTHLSNEFKYYFASISLANETSLNFITNSKGYKRVLATDTRAYFLTELHPTELTAESYESKRQDGTIVHFRFATPADIQELKQLNHNWMKENRTDLSNGYLAAMFSEDNWAFMIERKWVVLAEV